MVESGGQYILKPIPNSELELTHLIPINEHLALRDRRQIFQMIPLTMLLVLFADQEPAYLFAGSMFIRMVAGRCRKTFCSGCDHVRRNAWEELQV